MDKFNLYQDIKQRTNGTLLIGIVGPVRTGKSTFAKRFMDIMVLPNIKDSYDLALARDELPQAGNGKFVMTSEPKFIPKEAVQIEILPDVTMGIRLIDCVGFPFQGSMVLDENGQERMVETPWQDEKISFSKAALMGTQKVIQDHSNIAIVITCDGSFGEIARDAYVGAEESAIEELKEIGKPFVIILNTKKPHSKETKLLTEELIVKYQTKVLPINCEQLKKEDIHSIMEQILFEFPITETHFYLPDWFHFLPFQHRVRTEVVQSVRNLLKNLTTIHGVYQEIFIIGDVISGFETKNIDLATGTVSFSIQLSSKCYYEFLSELTEMKIENECELIKKLNQLSKIQKNYAKIKNAVETVNRFGYGVVEPVEEEIRLEEPTLIKEGNRYGIKLKSKAPSIHMIRADIETEIAPIIGTEQQARDVICYMKEKYMNKDEIWKTDIFGQSVRQLVEDGMRKKLDHINEESKCKLQETMRKVVNDSNGGLVCIII